MLNVQNWSEKLSQRVDSSNVRNMNHFRIKQTLLLGLFSVFKLGHSSSLKQMNHQTPKTLGGSFITNLFFFATGTLHLSSFLNCLNFFDDFYSKLLLVWQKIHNSNSRRTHLWTLHELPLFLGGIEERVNVWKSWGGGGCRWRWRWVVTRFDRNERVRKNNSNVQICQFTTSTSPASGL